METEGWIDGQALEILQPNIAHRTRLTVCVRVCDYFQSGGEVYRGRKGVFHSRWGQRGPVFLHPAELHKARYGEKKFQSSYRNKRHMFLLHKETNMYRKMVQRLVQGLCEKKCTLTKSNTLSVVHPHLKDAALFFSVSKAKVSDTAPVAIRSTCANTWKMKLKKITSKWHFLCLETNNAVCLLCWQHNCCSLE